MSIKIYPPFGKDANHKITQTYHSMPTQYAVDISGVAGRKVYGHAGTVVYVEQALGQKNYVAIDIGEPELLFYVHIKPSVKVGQMIRSGAVIGTVHPKVLFDTHLHFCFQRKDRGASNRKVMDYVSREANWYATGSAIRALWCKADGTLDWRKFGNRYVGVDEISELKLQVATLKAENAKLITDTKLLIANKRLVEERNEKLELDITEANWIIKDQRKKIELMDADIDDLKQERMRLMDENKELKDEINRLDTVNGLLSALFKKLAELVKPKAE